MERQQYDNEFKVMIVELLNSGIKTSQVSPSISGSYIYLQSVVSFIMVAVYAFILGYDEYAQDINFIKILSCLMVVAGVYLISKKPKVKLA